MLCGSHPEPEPLPACRTNVLYYGDNLDVPRRTW